MNWKNAIVKSSLCIRAMCEHKDFNKKRFLSIGKKPLKMCCPLLSRDQEGEGAALSETICTKAFPRPTKSSFLRPQDKNASS